MSVRPHSSHTDWYVVDHYLVDAVHRTTLVWGQKPTMGRYIPEGK